MQRPQYSTNGSFYCERGIVLLKAMGNNQGHPICNFTLDPIVRHDLVIVRSVGCSMILFAYFCFLWASLHGSEVAPQGTSVNPYYEAGG